MENSIDTSISRSVKSRGRGALRGCSDLVGWRHQAQRQARVLGFGAGGWGALVGRETAGPATAGPPGGPQGSPPPPGTGPPPGAAWRALSSSP